MRDDISMDALIAVGAKLQEQFDKVKQLTAELDSVKAERDAAVQVIYSCPTCSNCSHMDECDDIGGRCEGRGFGGDCHEPLPEPHFEWHGVVD